MPLLICPRLPWSTQLHGSSTPGCIIYSHPIHMLLKPEPLFLWNSVWMLNGRVQVLLRLCSSTICSQIDRMYIYRETVRTHAIYWCSKSCDCNKDKYDMTKFLVVMHEQLLWEYSTKSSTEAAQWSRLLSKFPTELCSGLSFCPSLPQIYSEVWGAPKFDYAIRLVSEHLRMLLQTLRAHCLAPGRSGSIEKYLQVLVRSPGVCGSIACCFQTN